MTREDATTLVGNWWDRYRELRLERMPYLEGQEEDAWADMYPPIREMMIDAYLEQVND